LSTSVFTTVPGKTLILVRHPETMHEEEGKKVKRLLKTGGRWEPGEM